MSRDLIPAHLARQLRAKADPDCPKCNGDGYVSYTARNLHGYTDVRCACVDRDVVEDEPGYGAGV